MQGLPTGGILYQPSWCYQNVLRLWEVLGASGHDMSRFVVLHIKLPDFADCLAFGNPEHLPSRFVRAGHSRCSTHFGRPGQPGCCAVNGPEPATFSFKLGGQYVPTECKPQYVYHVALATIDGLIYDLDQGEALWGSAFEEWLQHIALIEHPDGRLQAAFGLVTFKLLEHPMHRRDPALNVEYCWQREAEPSPSCRPSDRPHCSAATHGTWHGFASAITFSEAPLVINCVALPEAEKRIIDAVGWSVVPDLFLPLDMYQLDPNLDMLGAFTACEFRTKLATVLASWLAWRPRPSDLSPALIWVPSLSDHLPPHFLAAPRSIVPPCAWDEWDASEWQRGESLRRGTDADAWR